MIVVDTSVVAELLLQRRQAPLIAAKIQADFTTLHAPGLLAIELAQVVRRYTLAGSITATRGAQALADYVDLGVTTYEHELLLPRIWQLRDNLTAYDAAYVALAETLDATLLTGDSRLAHARGHHAKAELINLGS